jgi:hypothetical protein
MHSNKSKYCIKCLAFFFFCLMIFVTNAYSGTPIQVDQETVDFGQVKQGETVTAKFRITNTGSITQTIQFMAFSVPGMRANVNPSIEAGSSTEIILTWNTSGLSGEVKGETTLTLKDSQTPEVVLTFTGTVVP